MARPELSTPVVALTGAGLSTASGIPDYRSSGGVWERFDPMEFTIDRFHADPAGFWDRRARLVAAMRVLDAEPNAAHVALAEAARAGVVSHVVTQNVDGLHDRAGTPPERLLRLHGDGTRTRCLGCGGREGLVEVLARRVDGRAPSCRSCGGLLRPDVVLFGEPVGAMGRAVGLVADAATLLVAGTSLRVHPAARLVDVALAAGADVVVVDREGTPYDDRARVVRGAVEVEVPRLLGMRAGPGPSVRPPGS